MNASAEPLAAFAKIDTGIDDDAAEVPVKHKAAKSPIGLAIVLHKPDAEVRIDDGIHRR